MIDLNGAILICLLLLATVPVLFLRRRPGLETHGPFCLWRTKHGLRLLDRWAKYGRFWAALSDAGVIFAFGMLGAGYLYHRSKRDAAALSRILVEYALVTLISLAITLYVLFFGNSNFISMLFGGQIVLSPFLFLTLAVGGLGIFILVSVVANTFHILWQYFSGLAPIPGVAPLLPGVTVPGSPLSVPFHAIIALAILVAVHELGHGIVSRMEGVRVKSLGILTSGVVPVGAFTEPDEKQLRRSSPRTRLRVFSAGSMMNFVAGFAFLGLFLGLQATVQPTFVQDPSMMMPSLVPWDQDHVQGLVVTAVYLNSSAEAAGITPGTVINNRALAFEPKTPYKMEVLETDAGQLFVQRDADGLLGIDYAIVGKNYDIGIWAAKYGLEILLWIFLLNFLVGVINLLPFAIFDGARILEDISAFYLKAAGLGGQRLARKIMAGITAAIMALLLVNALPYFIARF